ncbi:MAG: AIR synthase related protein [Candidatus Pacebacteria bacterium]|nr:AIR synthase related protein [Candidatus Paceibacterota bacterium]MDR3583465.1 AIR synthase related protein [Candidatus Paceibacterota bacterium]
MTTYQSAGVDIDAGDQFARMIKERVKAAWPECGEEIGGFAGGGPIPQGAKEVKASMDGTGTVALIAALSETYHSIGFNLVGMCAVDTYVDGGRPLYFMDTLGVAQLIPDLHIQIIDSIIEACKKAGCKLIGGETAELPDMYKADWVFNLDGAVIGFPDPDLCYAPVRPGQKVYGWLSYGPGSNGFSLLRKVHNLKAEEGFWYHIRKAFGLTDMSLDKVIENLSIPRWELNGRALSEDLLVPTPIWIPEIEAQRKRGVVFAGHAHITGGGMPGNIPRILPNDCKVVIDRGTWTRPAIFRYTQDIGDINFYEMDKTFNQGIMVVSIVDPSGPLPDDSNIVEIGTVEKRLVIPPGLREINQVQFIGKHREE